MFNITLQAYSIHKKCIKILQTYRYMYTAYIISVLCHNKPVNIIHNACFNADFMILKTYIKCPRNVLQSL